MKHFTVLGRSNYTLAIICDALSCIYNRNFRLTIVSNIPDEENESLAFPFLTYNVEVDYLFITGWQPLPTDQYIIGIMGNARKKVTDFFVQEKKLDKKQFINLIHPSSIIPPTTRCGNGILIGPSVTLAPFVQLGDFVHINRNVSVGHHTSLSSFARINAGCTISGLGHIGEGVIIGPGCIILDKIAIGDHSIIGAASLVNKNIPPKVVAYGSPAKIIREITDAQ